MKTKPEYYTKHPYNYIPQNNASLLNFEKEQYFNLKEKNIVTPYKKNMVTPYKKNLTLSTLNEMEIRQLYNELVLLENNNNMLLMIIIMLTSIIIIQYSKLTNKPTQLINTHPSTGVSV